MNEIVCMQDKMQKKEREWCACNVVDSVREGNRIPASQPIGKRRKVIKKTNQSKGVYMTRSGGGSIGIHGMRNKQM